MLIAGSISDISGQPVASGDPILVSLPVGVNANRCLMRYFLTGPFGGYGGFPQSRSDVPELAIPTVHEGTQVEALRAYIYCSGYQVETLDLPSLRDVQSRKVQLQLKDLGTIPFSGTVLTGARLSSNVRQPVEDLGHAYTG